MMDVDASNADPALDDIFKSFIYQTEYSPEAEKHDPLELMWTFSGVDELP
jgi:hypothetical protein